MTNLFDQYVESILESTSFLDLPDSPPYGFWISPGGEFFATSFEEHYESGMRIILNNSKLKEDYKPKEDDVYNFLASRKYLRVVKENRMYLVDSFWYDREKGSTIRFTPSNSSMKTIKDIGEFYRMKIIILSS